MQAAAGGIAGYGMGQAVRMGIARGIFSNEAGLGSSVLAHANTQVSSPQVQGMWGMAEIFIDTMVVCTVTALVLLVSGVYEPQGFLSRIQTGGPITDGTTLTGNGFCHSNSLGAAVFGSSYGTFCSCYHFGLVLLWGTDGRVPGEGKRSGPVPAGLHSGDPAGVHTGAPDDMGTIGCLKWYDGCSKPAGSVFSGAGSAV